MIELRKWAPLANRRRFGEVGLRKYRVDGAGLQAYRKPGSDGVGIIPAKIAAGIERTAECGALSYAVAINAEQSFLF